MPFQDAVYVPVLDKIIGAMGPYVVKCNALTGAREATARVTSPVFGTMRLVYHAATGLVYASTWACPANQNVTAWPKREIWPINATTMVVGPALGIDSFMGQTLINTAQPEAGPRWMVSNGNYIYTVYRNGTVAPLRRFNPANTADRIVSGSATNMTGFWTEQGGTDGTYLYMCNPNSSRVNQSILATTLTNDYCDVTPYTAISAEWCPSNSKPYATDGEGSLIQIDDIPTNAHTVFNLNNGAIVPGTPGTCDPIRIRYRSLDQKLYLSCPTPGDVIVFDPASGTGTLKTGFENPVDVVFTTTKAFAVQDSLIGLKEIV